MANIQSAAKRNRQTLKRTARNRVLSVRIKSLRKEVLAAGAEGDETAFRKTFSEFASAVDKAVKANYIHKNKGINIKSKTFKAATATSAE